MLCHLQDAATYSCTCSVLMFCICCGAVQRATCGTCAQDVLMFTAPAQSVCRTA
jgi:hypothetical protein